MFLLSCENNRYSTDLDQMRNFVTFPLSSTQFFYRYDTIITIQTAINLHWSFGRAQ
jgi:hypothetical protein